MKKKIEVILKLSKTNHKLWPYKIYLDDDLAEELKSDGHRRVICHFENKQTKYTAIMQSPEGFYIMADKSLVKDLALEDGSEVRCILEKDESKYGIPLPPAFEACLNSDELGLKLFESLTPGKRRSLVQLVLNVKSEEGQLIRSLAIFEHLKRQKGDLDFKILREVFKEFSQRNKL